MEEERISKTIYFCPAINVELNSNTLQKWEKQIKMSLTIPKKFIEDLESKQILNILL